MLPFCCQVLQKHSYINTFSSKCLCSQWQGDPSRMEGYQHTVPITCRFHLLTRHTHSHCLFSSGVQEPDLYMRVPPSTSCLLASRRPWLTEGTKRKTKSRGVKVLTSTPTPGLCQGPGCIYRSMARVLTGSQKHSFLSCFFWSRGR